MHLSAIDLTLILLAQALLTVLPVGFTKPGSWIRKASIAVSTILMLISVFGHKDSYDCLTRMVLVFSPPALVLQNLNISFLRRWDFDYAGPQPREPGKREPSRSLPDSVWNRLAFGFCAATEYRHCATPWEVENVPRFRKNDPEFVPSRREFLVRRGLLLLCIYLFMDLLGVLASQDVNKAPTELLPLFGRIEDFTMREVLDRFILVVLFFVFGAASTTLHFGYGGYLLTLFGLTEPKRWRPVVNFEHGMPYSIRRLWSHYWHLCFKDMFYQPARYVVDHVLRLRRGSTARWYSIVALTFALSGIYHLLCDLTVGVPFGQSRSMVFFLGHACAVVLEDSVSRICSIQTGGKGGEKLGVEKVPRWQRWIGRVWVCAFLSWIVPIYMSPLFLAARDERLVPFSIVKALKVYME